MVRAAQNGFRIRGPQQQQTSELRSLGIVKPKDQNDAAYVIALLKSCSEQRDLEQGWRIHEDIVRRDLLSRSVSVGNTLLSMYAKCGDIIKAQEVFDELPRHSVVSWNALISGYSQNGLHNKALSCYEAMQVEGFSPNPATYVCVLKSCGCMGAIPEVEALHDQIDKEGWLLRSIVIGNALIDAYVKCGALAKARKVLEELHTKDVVSWTSLISGYTEYGLREEALVCIEEMEYSERFSPDVVTFICILKACAGIGALVKGQEIHVEIERQDCFNERAVGNVLVDMYAKCGALSKAQEIFNDLQYQDVVSWTALLAGYAQYGRDEEALDCFEQMLHKGVSPDACAFVCIVKVCGNLCAAEMGQDIHAQIARDRYLIKNIVLGNALLDMYIKCGILKKAEQVFDELLVRDEISWNAIITGHTQVGDDQSVIKALDTIIGEGKKPNSMTLTVMLNGCIQNGLIEKANMYISFMTTIEAIVPTLKHYTCIIDLLGRAGQLQTAVEIMMQMPYCSDFTAWLTLLGSCKKWGDVKVGKLAYNHLIELDANNAVSYLWMYSLYKLAGMEEDAGMIIDMGLERQNLYIENIEEL